MATLERQLGHYEEQGYVIVDDAVDAAILDELEAAGRRVRDKVRSGQVDVESIRGAQREPQVIWGLIAPEYGEPVLPSTWFPGRSKPMCRLFWARS